MGVRPDAKFIRNMQLAQGDPQEALKPFLTSSLVAHLCLGGGGGRCHQQADLTGPEQKTEGQV